MGSPKKGLIWKIGYGICCLIYAAWMVDLARNNFAMVHNDYRRAEEQLQPDRVKETALQELIDRCRQESRTAGISRKNENNASIVTSDPCLSWPDDVLQGRQKIVIKRLTVERHGTIKKLLLLYSGFGIIFLIMPPFIFYLLLLFIIWICKGIKK
jgi:hypothetical protein